jgi:arsenate reductase
MAHGFLQSFSSNIEVHSAGTRPAAQVNPLAVETMLEAGIDISSHTPKDVSIYLQQEWDYVITVCGGANESCPAFTGKVKHRLHMGFEDPSEATGTPEFIKSEFRRIRNQIRTGFRLFFHTNIEKLTVLYFGSFNPFHIGHASVAKFVAAQPWVEQLCFVLSPKNPLKESNTLQDANLRWEDLKRVVRKLNGETTCREEKFSASDIEFHLEPPLYTYNTLEKLSALHPRRHFALLMGGDNINILHKWYRGEEILNRYPIIVYPREGVDTEAICNKKGAIYIDAPMVNISSTQIRTMMAAGEDVSELRY